MKKMNDLSFVLNELNLIKDNYADQDNPDEVFATHSLIEAIETLSNQQAEIKRLRVANTRYKNLIKEIKRLLEAEV